MIGIIAYRRGEKFESNNEIVKNLRLFGLDELEVLVKESEVGKDTVELRVEIEEDNLSKVTVVEMRHHVEDESQNLSHDWLKGTRKFIS